MHSRSLIRQWLERTAVTLVVVAAACGSEHPTAPGIAPPAVPVTPSPTPQVDWSGLERLFHDPFFEGLPGQLENQVAAQSLSAAVVELETAIRIRNYDMLLGALERVSQERAAYLSCPCYRPREFPLLVTISLFQMRARAFLNGVEIQLDTDPLEGGQ